MFQILPLNELKNVSQTVGLFPSACKLKVTSGYFCLLITFIFSTLYNVKIWDVYFSNNDVYSFSGGAQAICFFLFVYAILFFTFSLFSFQWIQRITAIIAFLIAAPALYFSISLGVVFDKTMLQNVFETDLNESLDLLTFQFWVIYILLGIIPAAFVARLEIVYSVFWKQLVKTMALVGLVSSIAFAGLYTFYGELSFFVRNNNTLLINSLLPTAPLVATYKNVLIANQERKILDKEILDYNASINTSSDSNKNISNNDHNSVIPMASNKPLVLVVVVGETAREKSFSLKDEGLENHQETLLNRKNIFYYDNFWSCGTNTALSVPCMFSFFPKSDYKREMNKKYENVAEMISRIGYDVVWRNNNSGCKGICSRINTDPIDMSNSGQYAHHDEFYDEALVDDLAERIRQKESDQVIFLHQIGSHGPAYYKRVPDEYKLLQPACESQDFAQCSRTEIVNAYNNTILYTKRVINTAINKLDSVSDDYDTLLIYVSDHGESTGENGFYLHGLPYFMAPDEQKHIPALVWMSDNLITNRSISTECLKSKLSQRNSHDNFSHTLMGILNIKSKLYSKELDLVGDCVRN